MKKALCIILAVCMIICGTACGNGTGLRGSRSRLFNQKDDGEGVTPEVSSVCGRWEAVSTELEGSVFTIDEIKAMGDDSMDNMYFIIKEGGKVYCHSQDEGELTDWVETDKGIRIGEQELTFDGDKLVMEMDGQIYFEKVSDDQTITADEGTDDTSAGDDASKDDDFVLPPAEEMADESEKAAKDIEDAVEEVSEAVSENRNNSSPYSKIELPNSTGTEVKENDFVAEILEDDTAVITKYDT